MTLRDALVEAVDYIRSSGTEDPTLLIAAKKMERQAEKIRARTEAPAFWPHWCECGDRKEKHANFCNPCNTSFPFDLVQQFHLGTPKQSARARKKMMQISRNRLNLALGRRAA